MRAYFRAGSLLMAASILMLACTLSLLGKPIPPTPSAVTSSPPPNPTASPTALPPTKPTVANAAPATPTSTSVAFCADPRPLELIEKLEFAVRNSDGDLLSSLVSPVHGVDTRLFRDGRIVNYDQEHAAALFDSTFALNWGTAPGSGLNTVGSFHELVVPDLLDVLTRPYELACNNIVVGGATYTPAWPYLDIDFYSLHFPGSPTYDGLDWHTWLIGMHYVDQRLYLYAIMQLKWEP